MSEPAKRFSLSAFITTLPHHLTQAWRESMVSEPTPYQALQDGFNAQRDAARAAHQPTRDIERARRKAVHDALRVL